MVREVQKSDCGILFKEAALEKIGITLPASAEPEPVGSHDI